MCHGTEVRAGIQPFFSPAHSFENVQAFSALSVLSLPTIAQSVFCSCSFGLCCLWGWRCTRQQPPGDLMKTAASSSHPTPDNHYTSVREESNNAAEINKPACFLFKAKTKVGFAQLSRTAKPCEEGRKKCGYFWFLVWTKYFETGCAQEYFQKKSLKFEKQKKKFEMLYTCLVTLLLWRQRGLGGGNNTGKKKIQCFKLLLS